MKTVKFLLGGWSPEPGRLGYSYATTEDADVSGDYVPLAEAQALEARVASLSAALLAVVARVDEAEADLRVVVIEPGDAAIEAARELLGDAAPARVFTPRLGWNKDNIHLRKDTETIP